MMTENKHHDYIAQITQREFGAPPGTITRMNNGICNEVYTVEVAGREYIFRLNSEPRFMLGSRNNTPLFKSKGIKVPDILAEDYSKTWLPVAFQIQSKIDGRDIKDVIETLDDGQLKAIGADVANIFRQLASVPNNGKFGVLWGDDKDLVDSWSAEVARVIQVVSGWGMQTGVLDAKLEEVLSRINTEYKAYFDRVRPYTYFGDLSSKNVMIHEGQFSGLVDLDSLAQGDPLEAIGRIKASWYGTHYGAVYANAVMDSLGLPEPQRKIVTMYALLNRTFWTLENGVQFNQNTSRTIDRQREAKDKKAVADLLAELEGKPSATATMETGETPPSAEPEIQIRRPRGRPPKAALVEPVSAMANDHVQNPVEKPALIRSGEHLEKLVSTEPLPTIQMTPGELQPEIPDFESKRDFAEFYGKSAVNVFKSEPVPHSSQQKIMLEASGLSKTYVSDGVGFNALKNVDLRVHKGDCIAIVGKSGSGKSTLMHLLACLDIPTEGYVYVDGDDISTMSEQERNRLRNEKFGFVFQQFFLNGRDTVFENIVLPLRIRGASDFDITTDADEALAAVGLVDKTGNKAKDLSGGEKQRVCVARAIVGKPQVIFADEPTGNLDSNTGAAVEQMLFDLNREKGITLVIVTHDADLARRCGRIVEMKDGQIVGEYIGEAAKR